MMKYAMILPDGAADEPLEELQQRTPLEAANIPNIDWIAANGRQGTVTTIPEGFLPGSDVASLSVLGYDPKKYYTGRAPLEALAQNLRTGPNDLIFRCNLVTIVDGDMRDFSAGHITQAEAEKLIESLNEQLGTDRIRFYPGVSYRHLLVLKDTDDCDPVCTPPHDILEQPIAKHLPRGKGADLIRDLMNRSRQILPEHDVNLVRADLEESPANSIWLWGQGKTPAMESFSKRFGVSGVLIAAVDLIRGLGSAIRWKMLDVEGATGYLDTNYQNKGSAAVKALDDFDLVTVHIEAPDEAGHSGDASAKVKALEEIDTHIVGPVLNRLREFGQWRILVVPDHPTPVRLRTHTATPPPFCMAGTKVSGLTNDPFCEKNAAASSISIEPGHELIEYFLHS